MSFLRSAANALVLSLLFTFTICVFAQGTETGLVRGTVLDQNGAVIPAAVVTLTANGSGFSHIFTTREDGEFVFNNVPAGTYTLLVKREGFASTEVPDLSISGELDRSFNVELRVSDQSGTGCDLVPDQGLLHRDSSVSTVIPQKFPTQVPLNGRSSTSLSQLPAGIVITTSNPASDTGQFSVNGLRPNTTVLLIDGVPANFGIGTGIAGATNTALAGGYPAMTVFGAANNLFSLEDLYEFQIQTANYSPEFGRQMGAQVMVITRSGTNRIRGSLYEYFRNDALEARNYFNRKPAAQTPLKHHLFGGTIGGPVYFPNLLPSDKPGVPGAKPRSGFYNGKDKTFFFASYEGVRMRQPSSGVQYVPSARLRSMVTGSFGPIVNAFPIQTGAETTTLTPCTPPNPNCAPNGRLYSGWAPYAYSISNPGSADTISVRLDHQINNKHSFFGRFVDSRSELDTGSFTTTNERARTNMFTLGVASILNSHMTNEFRFGYGKHSAVRSSAHNPIDGAVAFSPSLLTNGFMGEGSMDVAFNGSANSLRTGTSVDNAQQQFVVADSFTYVVGPHTLKFGANFRRLNPHYRVQDIQAGLVANQNTLLAGNLTALAVSAIMPVRPRYENFSAFAQDTWKVNKRLTLDYGLRWDVNPAPTEADGIITPVISGINGADVSNATLQPFGTPYYATDYSGFAPRVGAAYQLSRKNRWETVVRGGFGVFYDMGSTTAGNGSPFGLVSLRLNVPFPVSAANATRPTLSSTFSTPFFGSLYTTDPELKLPYALHWNVGVEQELDRSNVVSLSYVATAGRRLLVTQSLNPLISGLRQNPNFGPIIYSSNGSESDYHSLQAQYRVRLGNGLQGLANYTWSHAIDTASNDIVPGVLDRGNADFDVRHNFSGAVNYDLPSFGRGKAIKYLTKDWFISSIVHLQSGRPVDIAAGTVVVDGRLVNRRPNYVGGELYVDDLSVPGGRRFNVAAFSLPMPGQQGSFGRNVLRDLPIYQFDVAVGRSFEFTEDVRLTLKAEAFNVLNHPMFGTFGTNILSPSTFGVPMQTLNQSLGGLNPIYQIGGPRAVQLAARLSF